MQVLLVMKATSLFVFFVLLAAISMSRSARADDRITAIDVANSIITVDKNGAPKVFKVKQFTEITLNGAPTQLDQIKPGMSVRVTLDSNQTALKLAASG